MTVGLVLGKFNPLHLGHIALIEFASKRVDELIVLICASDKEKIDGITRLNWVKETFQNNLAIKPQILNYKESELPNTSVSSKEVSKMWASKIETIFPKLDIIFSSEIYGDYLADFLKCKHISFEPLRTTHQISASKINENIFENWAFLANATKPFYVKKICIYGTESTGKSTLTEKLAHYYHTDFVPEMAREIVEETTECTAENLIQIAELQANTINEKLKTANKILFVDTDLNITCSYSEFLFSKKLIVEKWVEDANHFDLYIYLDNDAPHIQDGTRLEKERRDALNNFHRKQLTDKFISFELINGNWQERYEKSIIVINKFVTT